MFKRQITMAAVLAVSGVFGWLARRAKSRRSPSRRPTTSASRPIYLYPLISVDLSRRVGTNVEPGKVPDSGR